MTERSHENKIKNIKTAWLPYYPNLNVIIGFRVKFDKFFLWEIREDLVFPSLAMEGFEGGGEGETLDNITKKKMKTRQTYSLQLQMGRGGEEGITHLRYAHNFAVKVFDRHAQQTVRFVSGTGVDVVVETRVLRKKPIESFFFSLKITRAPRNRRRRELSRRNRNGCRDPNGSSGSSINIIFFFFYCEQSGVQRMY